VQSEQERHTEYTDYINVKNMVATQSGSFDLIKSPMLPLKVLPDKGGHLSLPLCMRLLVTLGMSLTVMTTAQTTLSGKCKYQRRTGAVDHLLLICWSKMLREYARGITKFQIFFVILRRGSSLFEG
jgi:hypothetical protein